jgi:tetratricopeptide (TPR) repeat protein
MHNSALNNAPFFHWTGLKRRRLALRYAPLGEILRPSVFAILFITIITGCANPINRKTASNYYQWGIEAELAGDYVLAERNYERSFINAQIGQSPDAGISAVKYNLGRVKGYLCKYDDADGLLRESLALEETVTGKDSSITTMRLFELARLNLDRGKYAASLQYFERGIPAVKRLGLATTDPIGLANALDDYSLALAKSGNTELSENTKAEANSIRATSLRKTAVFKPVRYNRSCVN